MPPLTLLDVKNHLFSHFLEQTTFSLKEDLGDVQMGAAYDDPKGKMGLYKEPLLRAALEDMVKANVLLVLDQVNGVYMLTAPLGAFNQNVVVSPYTADLLAKAFNYFTRQAGNVPYVANKLAITDVEIQTVAHLCFAFRDEADELLDAMEGDDDPDMPPTGVADPTAN